MKNVRIEMNLNQIKRLLEQYIYWQIEATHNLMSGDVFSILPQIYIVEKAHQISVCAERLEDTDVNWEQLYTEASEVARKKWFDENTAPNLKVVKDEHKNTNA